MKLAWKIKWAGMSENQKIVFKARGETLLKQCVEGQVFDLK